MEEQALFGNLKQAIIEGDSDALTRLVRASIDHTDPLAMIENGMMPGMTEIGDKFSTGEVFLPELLMAAEAFQEAMKIIKPRLDAAGASMKKQGTIVIGDRANGHS